MNLIRHRSAGIRAACLAAVLATAGALLSSPSALADSGSGGDRPVRLTAGALKTLTEQYTQRSDGTPGLVAAAREEGADTTGITPRTDKQSSESAAEPDAAAKALTTKARWETPRGVASTLALGGTHDWVGLFSGGAVTRYDADGTAVWQRTSHSLYTDWQVKPKNAYQAEEFTTVLHQGYNPYQPTVSGTHPFAQADFNHDGVDDIAVAYSVGGEPAARPFTSPGSDLQSGTFVSLLDGRTGTMLWHKLLPGYVGSLTAQDGKLIAANVTGPDWGNNPVAEAGDSRSSLTAYAFDRGAHGAVTARTAWTYNTKAPYALWSDIETMGKGRVTVSWTDTPMGLGSPRPAAGHVMVLDTDRGKVLTDVRTPGYPRIVHKDPHSDRVLVAEQNDPTDAVRWDLTAVDVKTGKRSVLTSRENTIPEAFVVNADAHGKQARYAVAELGINADLTDGTSSISGWDERGRTTWTYRTQSTVGRANAPTQSLTVDPRGRGQVYAAVSDPVGQTRTRTNGPEHSQLIALDATSGRTQWRKDGAVVGGQVTPYRGGMLTVGYDLTAYKVGADGDTEPLPLLGDAYTGVATDVNGDGVEDIVVGGQSRGVFALDGRTMDSPNPRVLWVRALSASIRRLTLDEVEDSRGRGARRIVAATSHGFAVLTPQSGKPLSDVALGTFQAGVAVADGHVIASGDKVSAYTADGRPVWSYRPAGTSGKTVVYSVPATADGRIYLEYGGVRSSFGTGVSDPAPTAVALDAAKGSELWSMKPQGLAATWIEQQAGVFADRNVPGADGHAVAFAWGGDQPSTVNHLVQTVDGRTGEVLTSENSPGAATFLNFAASPRHGLVELSPHAMTVHPADGGASYLVRVLSFPYQGTFATTGSGDETLVVGTLGVYGYGQPFEKKAGGYVNPGIKDFALAAGSIVQADLDGDKATDLIALQRDWGGYSLSQNVGGYGDNTYAVDHYQHGVSVLEMTDAPAAKAPAARSAAVGAPAAAAPVEAPTLPIGRATPSIDIHSSSPATGSVADEVTKGYTPRQIRTRLGLTGDGSGQTVAITVAYDYPTAKADLNHFSEHFGLPQTCDTVAEGTDCFDFEQVYATGEKPAANTSWAQEAALDIEWVHSVAPKARVVLVEAADASASGLAKAIDVAASFHPAAVNNSWGMSEYSEESFYDTHCKLADSVCTQSTGDFGYPAGYSSTNPYALAIGGTKLVLDSDGNTTSETAWASTGGGLSYFEPRPAYQNGVQPSAYRATPDVSFVADPNTGVAVYTSATGTGTWMQVGGTSLSSPIWAGIVAAADQLRAADGRSPLAVAGPTGDTAHAAVYGLGSALRDITAGGNGYCGAECTAGPGYDTVTGLGSPNAGVDKALAAWR
ncbi:hypothetical protein AB0M42_16980 [Streptomyces sp. NPDC051784]|uniref:hypothetical protein n=1 Tax=Streptomyces sp. NPDC051784 TaxID=3155805 RepID=UPI003421A2CA